MSAVLIMRPIAKVEFDEAANWYDTQRRGLGESFVNAVQDVLDTVVRQPARYPVAGGDTREAAVVGFPYCVYFRVKPGRAIVTAVLHTSRDPAVWRSRS